jgi:hypothetical protein
VEELRTEMRSPFLDIDPDHKVNLKARKAFLTGLKALGVPDVVDDPPAKNLVP